MEAIPPPAGRLGPAGMPCDALPAANPNLCQTKFLVPGSVKRISKTLAVDRLRYCRPIGRGEVRQAPGEQTRNAHTLPTVAPTPRLSHSCGAREGNAEPCKGSETMMDVAAARLRPPALPPSVDRRLCNPTRTGHICQCWHVNSNHIPLNAQHHRRRPVVGSTTSSASTSILRAKGTIEA